MTKVIAIIPVKSDSKRFLDKNFKEISRGIPLIINTLDKLFKCGQVDEVYISTDDVKRVHDIVSTTPRLSDYVLSNIQIVKRPANLVGDAKLEDVVKNVYKEHMDTSQSYTFVLTQITSPLWNYNELTHAILKHKEITLPIISVSPNYHPNGCFYIINSSDLFNTDSFYTNNIYLKVLSWKQSIDIDYEYQLYIAKAIYSNTVYM